MRRRAVRGLGRISFSPRGCHSVEEPKRLKRQRNRSFIEIGGLGLKLTAASYVVLYDPWWNPAVENQANDRTHRIGQTSHVIAYRLIVKESIEEKSRKLQRSKRALAADILGEESFTRALTLDDFRFLLGE